ncbi:MAG TPA: FecR domain-containing protein [Mucilaginibacter sp.]
MKDAGKKLLQLLHKQQLSTDDKQWLLDYIENTDQNELRQLLDAEFTSDINDLNQEDFDFPDQVLTEIYRKAGIPEQQNAKIVHIWIKRLSIAAAFAGLFLAVSFWVFKVKKNTIQGDNQTAGHVFKNDVAPGSNKAILTLSNGKTIVLDSAKNGVIASQGNSNVTKSHNGELVYSAGARNVDDVVFNTISTPRGGYYQVELPDGSKAWLNAASSIRFPTSFAGKERRVEITGEAYFEVTKNKQRPFIVKVNNSEIRVLGTHFNVNAYNDESSIRTTLLEGAVQFSSGLKKCLLKPGQQSELDRTGQINVIEDVDVDGVLAWKNGLLHFEDVDIESVMRRLSRWYDVDIVYHNKTSDHFFVELPAQSKLSDVLKMMELTGRVSFEIHGKKVIVN